MNRSENLILWPVSVKQFTFEFNGVNWDLRLSHVKYLKTGAKLLQTEREREGGRGRGRERGEGEGEGNRRDRGCSTTHRRNTFTVQIYTAIFITPVCTDTCACVLPS